MKTIRFILFTITLAVGYLNIASAGSRGPEFVEPESLPEAFRNTMHAIVDGMNSGNIAELEQHFDFRTIGIKAGKELFNSEREYRDFATGMQTSRHNVLSSIVTQIQAAGGDMTLTGYVRRAKLVLPQVRLDLGDYGLDYIEYQLEQKSDGSYQVVDWYNLSTGRMYSQTIAIGARLLIDPDPGILKKLLGITEVDKNSLKIITAMGQARRNADFVEANRLYATLPPEIRNTRVFLEMGIGFANLANDDALYRKRLNTLAEKHGADPSAAFLLIDHYYYEGNVDKALANIEVMERQIGKDGYTTFLKANLHVEMAGDYAGAEALYREAIDIEPYLDEPYETLAYVYILQDKFAEAVEVYQLQEKQFDVRYSADDFFDTPEVNRFKASAEFRQWMNSP